MLKYEKRDRTRAEITGRDHLGRAEITGRDHLGRAEITRAEIVEGRDHRTPEYRGKVVRPVRGRRARSPGGVTGRDHRTPGEITGRDNQRPSEITRAEIVEGRDHRYSLK